MTTSEEHTDATQHQTLRERVVVLVKFGLVAVSFPVLVALHLFGLDNLGDGLLCTILNHRWADEEKYGVEPVCLNCGVER